MEQGENKKDENPPENPVVLLYSKPDELNRPPLSKSPSKPFMQPDSKNQISIPKSESKNNLLKSNLDQSQEKIELKNPNLAQINIDIPFSESKNIPDKPKPEDGPEKPKTEKFAENPSKNNNKDTKTILAQGIPENKPKNEKKELKKVYTKPTIDLLMQKKNISKKSDIPINKYIFNILIFCRIDTDKIMQLLNENQENIHSELRVFFVAEHQEFIPLSNLNTSIEIISKYCKHDFSGMHEIVLKNKPENLEAVSYINLIEITKQWIDSLNKPEARKNEIIQKSTIPEVPPAESMTIEEKIPDSEQTKMLLKQLENSHTQINEIFKKFANMHKGFIPLGKTKEILKEMFDCAKIIVRNTKINCDSLENIDKIANYIANIEKEQTSITKGIDYNKIVIHLTDFFNQNAEFFLEIPHETDEFTSAVETSIRQYEELAQKQKILGKNNSATRNLVSLLKSQLNNKNTKTISRKSFSIGTTRKKDKLTLRETPNRNISQIPIEEMREKGLNEIFTFYCRQQRMNGRNITFEQLESGLTQMTMGEFIKMCKDFLIPLKMDKIRALFTFCAKQGRTIDIDCFMVLLQKVANQLSADKIEDLKLKVEKIDEELLKLNEDLINQITETNEDPRKIQLESEKEHYEKEILNLETESDQQKLLDLYILMECDDPIKYRPKLKTIALPFHTKDKSYRIPLSDPSRKYKFRINKNIEEIRKQVELVRQERLNRLRVKVTEERDKYSKNRHILQKIYEKQLSSKQNSIILSGGLKIINPILKQQIFSENEPQSMENQNYDERPNVQLENQKIIQNEVIPQNKPSNQKITWDILNNLSYNDIKPENDNLDFKLGDFINENDNENDTEEIYKKIPTKVKIEPKYSQGIPAPRGASYNRNSVFDQNTVDYTKMYRPVNLPVRSPTILNPYEQPISSSNKSRQGKTNLSYEIMERANQIENEEKNIMNQVFFLIF